MPFCLYACNVGWQQKFICGAEVLMRNTMYIGTMSRILICCANYVEDHLYGGH